MATINNVVIPNVQPQAPPVTSLANQVWKLTRALKKAGWKYIGSGNGTTKETTKDPELDLWNVTPSTTSMGGAAAVIGAPQRGRALVTGLTGIVSADKGRFLVISGSGTGANNHHHQIEEVISSTSVRIDARTFAVAADAGPLSWSIVDYSIDNNVQPGWFAAAGWWAARGPSVLRIPYTVAQTPGTSGYKFVRGENIVQTTTGAQGECLGCYEDGANSYMAVLPRVRGTGAGVYGWDTALTITGALSGATIAQDGAAKEYRAELVIQKSANLTSGTMCMHYAEPVGEQTAESLIPSAGCTATVAPGHGGTGNAFPSFAWTFHGNPGSTAFNWSLWSSSVNGNAQIIAWDCIEEENYSADGSWAHAVFNGAQGALPYSASYLLLGFFRLDDTEPGDVCPFATKSPGYAVAGGLYTNTRTTLSSQTSTWYEAVASYATQANYVSYRSWRRRGMSDDAATNSQDYEPAVIAQLQSSFSGGPQNINATTPYNVQNAPVFTRQINPIFIRSVQAGPRKHDKGKVRHLGWLEGGTTNALYADKTILQLALAYTGLGGYGPTVVDGWDGVTTPVSFGE